MGSPSASDTGGGWPADAQVTVALACTTTQSIVMKCDDAPYWWTSSVFTVLTIDAGSSA